MEKLRAIIEEQRKGKENTPVFMVGEQLIDIAEREPNTRELLFADLQVPEMSLAKAEAKIKEYSDKHRGSASSFCVSPKVAEGILREFYGLPTVAAGTPASATPSVSAASDYVDLDSFL